MHGKVIRLSRLRLTAAFSSRVMKSCSASPAIARRRLHGRRQQRHPLADEVARRQRRRILHQRLHAAALGVPEHDDVFDAQDLHAELQRGGDAVCGAVRRIGRNEVGDVADDEQFARLGVEDHLRRYPRVAAADHHHLRRLPAFRQFAVARLLGRQALGREGPVAGNQPFGKRSHMHPIANRVSSSWPGERRETPCSILDPAIHVLRCEWTRRRGCPAQGRA